MRAPVFCGKDCGGGACPMLAEVEGGRVGRILPNPASGKYVLPCSRGLALADQHHSPLRLTKPLVRKTPHGDARLSDFRETSWEEALALAAARLGESRATHGPASTLSLAGFGGTGALHATNALAGRFLSLFGGYTGLGGSYSNGAARTVLPYVLGPEWKLSGFDPATMRHARMIVLWGANVLEARLGAEIPARLLEARALGATIVAIDPRRTPTVERAATWHIPCRPGTDTALMLALLAVLLEEGLAKVEWASERSVGFAQLADYVLGRADGLVRGPDWAEGITGVPAAETRRLARAWAASSPVMLFPGYSIQRVRGGEETYRLTLALQLATGNFGLLGGSTGSLNNRLPTPRVGSIDSLDAPGRPTVPVLRWPDAILGGRAAGFPADLHSALVAAGNWLGQGADVRKSARALDALDFSVCIEMFPTATALRCDFILPAASPLEKEDIGLPWLGNWLTYKSRLVEPLGQARSDYGIYAALADLLGFGGRYSEGRSEGEWVDAFLAKSVVPDAETFKRAGFWAAPEQERVGLADFARDPAAHPLGTPSGRVELACPAWVLDRGGSLLPSWEAAQKGRPEAAGDFLLISPKVAHRTHSQGGDPASVAASGGHFLEMSPADASSLSLVEGAWALVGTADARVRARVRLSPGMMPGTLSLAEGTWIPEDSNKYEESASPNLLTSTDDHGPATAVSMHAIPVRVSKAAEDEGASAIDKP